MRILMVPGTLGPPGNGVRRAMNAIKECPPRVAASGCPGPGSPDTWVDKVIMADRAGPGASDSKRSIQSTCSPGMADAEGTGYDPTQTPDWVRALVEECASFPNAAHDDQVDALSQALVRLAGTSGGLRRRERMAGEMAGVREMEF